MEIIPQQNKDLQVSRENNDQGWRIYTINGKNYISVTTALDIVCDDASKDFYLSVTKESYAQIMYKTSTKGTRIHKAVEDHETTNIEDVEADLLPAYKSFLALKKKHNIKPVWYEKTLYSDVYGYAGSGDMLAQVDGKLCICDLKTGQYNFKHGFQVAAYRLAAIEMGLIDDSVGTCLIYCHRDGREGRIYTHKHFDFLEHRFLEALGLHRGLYANTYRSLEYPWKWETPLEEYFARKFGMRPEPKDYLKEVK